MSHRWPARQPRPILEKIDVDAPLVTGVRVLDALFPMAKGGTGSFPGAFGCGKGGLIHALTRRSNSHISIYTGCGERGTEMV
jgi:vacuolar-type H+-ATPase catalytic subunit A/Vma1